MKKLLLALALLLAPSMAFAQCNGVFPANKVCGTIVGGLPSPQSPTSFQGSAGGVANSVQYNNAGSLGGITVANNQVIAGTTGAPASAALQGSGGLFDTICSSTIGQAWVRLTGGWGCLSLGWANPVWWGADPTGVADSTSAINSAAAANTNVFIPAGTFKVTSSLVPPANATWSGAGFAATVLQTNSATLNTLTISNQNVTIQNIGFSASVTRSAGWFIDIGASQFWLHDFQMTAPFEAIRIQDAISIVNIDRGTINNAVAGSGNSIRVGSGSGTGPVALAIRHVIASAPSGSKPFAHLVLANVGDLTLVDDQFLSASCGIYAAPTTSQVVVSVKMIGGFSDSNGGAVCIQPSGSGVVERSSFSVAWLSQSSGANVTIAPTGTATVDGIDFTGSEIYGGTNGFSITQASGTAIKNISINGNRVAGASGSGVNINAAANAIISNNIIGSAGGFGVNATAIILAGTIGQVLIENNDLSGSTAKISNSMTSSLSRIEGNISYNPVGLTAGTSTGTSASTITAGPSPETHYITQSATFNAAVKSGATTLCTVATATVPCVIQLGPNESYSVTWTTTQPTYSKFVH
jgi:hypothetical protein